MPAAQRPASPPPRLRVGLDYRPALRASGGIGRYVEGLSRALAANGCDLRLYGVFFKGNRRERRVVPPGARLVAWKLPSRLFEMLNRVGAVSPDQVVGGCSVFHHTDFRIPPKRLQAPEVMTIHDLAFLRLSQAHSYRARQAMAAVVRRAARRCAAILCPSEATARDCLELLHVADDRVHVTPLGVDPSFFRPPAPPKERAPYLLAVGTIEPRKNTARLVRAFDRIAARHPGLELLLAGRWGWHYDEVVASVVSSPARMRIRMLGRVPEEELRRLMAGAEMLLYPSLLEGFGLPVLEGMAAGLPVLTSDLEPLRTLAGDAALLVDPQSEEAIADGIERLLSDSELRRRLRQRGPERARRFTWEECAAATRRAYETVLG